MLDSNHEALREQQRTAWRSAAPGWVNRRNVNTGSNQLITDVLLDEARIGPGQHVLDLASGVGEPAFAIADRVGPEGYVLGLDLTQEMVDAATAWALEHGTINVEFRRIETELDLGVPPQSMDAVTCRFGLMFVPDPIAALGALRDSVKAGGRIAIATWSLPERCPHLVVPDEILSRHVDLPHPDLHARGPFALSSGEILESIFHAAGWEDVRTAPLVVYPLEADTPEEYWDMTLRMAGPAISRVRSLPEETQRAIRDDAVSTLRGLMQDGKVRLSAEALVTGATRSA
jgi:SAM-dependent methyltransferase